VSDLKTRPTKESVQAFLKSIEDPDRRRDCRTVMKIMKEATGARPKMWGPSIVGYGSYHYKYASGREGDWFLTGFSPRKQNLTLYMGLQGFEGNEALLKKLGKHKTGKSCVYVKKLEDVDLDVLQELIHRAVERKGSD
jgi:hypothetical protein